MGDVKGKIGPVGPTGCMARHPNVFFESAGSFSWTDEHGKLQKLCLSVQDFLVQYPWIASVVEISRWAITSSGRYGLLCSCVGQAGSSGIAGATPEDREVIIIAHIKLGAEFQQLDLESIFKVVQMTDRFMKSCHWRINKCPDFVIEIYAYKEEMMFSIGWPDKS